MSRDTIANKNADFIFAFFNWLATTESHIVAFNTWRSELVGKQPFGILHSKVSGYFLG